MKKRGLAKIIAIFLIILITIPVVSIVYFQVRDVVESSSETIQEDFQELANLTSPGGGGGWRASDGGSGTTNEEIIDEAEKVQVVLWMHLNAVVGPRDINGNRWMSFDSREDYIDSWCQEISSLGFKYFIAPSYDYTHSDPTWNGTLFDVLDSAKKYDLSVYTSGGRKELAYYTHGYYAHFHDYDSIYQTIYWNTSLNPKRWVKESEGDIVNDSRMIKELMSHGDAFAGIVVSEDHWRDHVVDRDGVKINWPQFRQDIIDNGMTKPILEVPTRGTIKWFDTEFKEPYSIYNLQAYWWETDEEFEDYINEYANKSSNYEINLTRQNGVCLQSWWSDGGVLTKKRMEYVYERGFRGTYIIFPGIYYDRDENNQLELHPALWDPTILAQTQNFTLARTEKLQEVVEFNNQYGIK